MSRYEQIYVVHCPETGLYKIGKTGSFVHRFAELQACSAYPLERTFLFICPIGTANIFERILHNRFHHKRTHGEWLKLNEDDLAFFTAQRPTVISLAMRHVYDEEGSSWIAPASEDGRIW